jgi:hypothetical protein
MKASKMLTSVVLLQGVILLGQWGGQPSLPTASAQIPDAGQQNALIIDQLKATNTRLDRVIAILESGNLQVRAVTPDEAKKAPAR